MPTEMQPSTLGPETNTPLVIEWWPIERLKVYPKNARQITRSSVTKVAASIKEFGWRASIVVDENDVIVMGHVRRLAAIKLRLKVVPVHVAKDLSPQQIRALRIADNRTHDETEWSEDLLARELAELDSLDIDLAHLTGFNDDELNTLLGDPLAEELAAMGHDSRGSKEKPDIETSDEFEIVVTCESEAKRQELLARFALEGLTCRILTAAS